MSARESPASLIKFESFTQEASWDNDATRFLRFSLGGETVGLLPLERLVEVIKVRPQEILPIPTMPEYLLGIANSRGEAVWIVDLLYFMGAKHLSRREMVPSVCMTMLVQAGEKAIGLMVEQVSSIEVYNLQNLQPLPQQILPSNLLSFVEGYFIDSKGTSLILLAVDAIIKAVDRSD